MKPTPLDPPGRTFTVACPYCSVDVVTKPRAIRVDSELRQITASVDLFAPHACGEPADAAGTPEKPEDVP